MGWRFAPDRGVRADLERALDHLVERALVSLADGATPSPHETRKAMKRVRALVRLARGAIDAAARHRLVSSARTIGRRLSPLRDAEVLPGTIVALRADAAASARGALNRALTDARAELAQARADARPALVDAVARLVGLRDDARRLRVAGGWSRVGRGLARAYRRAASARASLQAASSSDAFHAWRKRVKDLEHQLDAFAASGTVARAPARGVGRLADALGEEHDLGELARRLRGGLGGLDTAARANALAAVADRRARLRAEALALAPRVLAAPPAAFARGVATAWRRARRRARR